MTHTTKQTCWYAFGFKIHSCEWFASQKKYVYPTEKYFPLKKTSFSTNSVFSTNSTKSAKFWLFVEEFSLWVIIKYSFLFDKTRIIKRHIIFNVVNNLARLISPTLIFFKYIHILQNTTFSTNSTNSTNSFHKFHKFHKLTSVNRSSHRKT